MLKTLYKYLGEACGTQLSPAEIRSRAGLSQFSKKTWRKTTLSRWSDSFIILASMVTKEQTSWIRRDLIFSMYLYTFGLHQCRTISQLYCWVWKNLCKNLDQEKEQSAICMLGPTLTAARNWLLHLC